MNFASHRTHFLVIGQSLAHSRKNMLALTASCGGREPTVNHLLHYIMLSINLLAHTLKVDTPDPRDVDAKAGHKFNTIVLNTAGGDEPLEDEEIESYVYYVGSYSTDVGRWVVAKVSVHPRAIRAASKGKL